MNREDWLTNAVTAFRPYYTTKKLEIPTVKVSCGFPSKSALSANRRLGETWDSDVTFDGTRHIFISPLINDPIQVLGVLTHELLHSALPDDTKHGIEFKRAMVQIGLEGKATSAMPGPELSLLVADIALQMGDYPNPAIRPKDRKAKSAGSKNQFKLFCPDKRACTKKCLLLDKAIESDYTVSAGKKSLELGFPYCPCGSELEMEPADFEEYKLLLDKR